MAATVSGSSFHSVKKIVLHCPPTPGSSKTICVKIATHYLAVGVLHGGSASTSCDARLRYILTAFGREIPSLLHLVDQRSPLQPSLAAAPLGPPITQRTSLVFQKSAVRSESRE